MPMSVALQSDFSSQVLDCGIEAIDPLEIERLRRIKSAKEPDSGLSAEELLTRLGLISPEGKIKAAGLLLLGKEEFLRKMIPGHSAIFLHMKNDVEYDRRLDSFKPLLAMLDEFSASVEPHNRIFTLKFGLFHFEIFDFPPEVYREALLNAFTHRDYSIQSPVYLRLFPERLEVSSPGGFISDVTPENIVGHEPISRNPFLAEVLERIRLVERAGMGVKRMFQILLSYGKEPPTYEAGADYVRVTIRSGRAEGKLDENFARFVVRCQQEGRELKLPDLLILNWLKRNREVDVTEAKTILGRSEKEAHEVLSSMVNRGLLEQFGEKKGRVYRLSKRVYAQLRKSVSYYPFRRAESAYAESTIINYLEELTGPEEERFITNEIVRTLLRVSPHQAGYILAGLVKKGKLTLKGKGRAARYYKSA
ncbi:MAG: ATP-binding protein [candidate division WOR-3 bacterium]